MLLGLGGCTGRGGDAAGERRTGSPDPNGPPDEPTDGSDSTSGSDGGSPEPTGALRSSPPTATEDHPALSSVLSDVLAAEDPAEHARERGLEVDGAAVLVVVELVSADAELPTEHVRSVERRQGALVRAYVPFETLVPLANEDAVRFVRPPFPASATNGTEGSS